MNIFYTPETFNPDKYYKSGWRVSLHQYDFDEFETRLIVNVATGRKYWPIFSTIISPELGLNDPGLKEIKLSLQKFTHPMIDRFVNEINIMLSDIYQQMVDIRQIEIETISSNYYSTIKI